MNVDITTKLEPFSVQIEDYAGFYVWNADDEYDLLGTVTQACAGARWTQTHGKFGAHSTRDEAVEALVRATVQKRLRAQADVLLRRAFAGLDDSWLEDFTDERVSDVDG